MKHFFLLFITLLMINPAYADNSEDNIKNRVQEQLKSYSTEDFIQKTKHLKKRTPGKVFEELGANRKQFQKPQCSIQIQSGDKVEMPENAIFPGEFEEIQSVLIAWPYFSADREGKINYYLDQIFPGKSIIFDRPSFSYKLIDIISVPDVYPQSPYSKIFAQLADAIQQEVPVWINIWSAEDSLDILEFMEQRGTPLFNYRFFINPGNSFWYRDCGPVGFYYGEDDQLAFLDFEYYGGRPLDDEIPINLANEIGIPVFTTEVEFEGGNILVDGDGTLFTTDAVYELNADTEGKLYLDPNSVFGFSMREKTPMSNSQLIDSLKYLMNLNNVHVFDKLIHDGGTGHIDLYADFYDENTFVFTQMPEALSHFPDYSTSRRNIDAMLSLSSRNNKPYLKRYIPFPRKDNGNWYNDTTDYKNYTRTYSNHLFVNKTIIQPVFYNNITGYKVGNDEAIAALKLAYPGYNIVPIDVRSFDGSGGAIHCITKQIPAENPLRIFHYPVQFEDKLEAGFPVFAEITNHSGIANAQVYWRLKGQTSWNILNLTKTTDNSFYAVIPDDNLNENDEIEYYISATSNNNKTITKPMPAPEGFYSFANKFVSVADAAQDFINEFYPNPANEFSSISISSQSSDKVHLSIFSSTGETLYERNIDINSNVDTITLNTSLLPNGFYFVKIQLNSGQVFVKKLNVIR